jgi:hypothetical protein
VSQNGSRRRQHRLPRLQRGRHGRLRHPGHRLPAGGHVIRFSDNEWNGLEIGAGGAFNTGEGGFTWAVGAAIPAGTAVEFLNVSDLTTRSVNLGALTGGTLALGNSGEAIFAFQGPSEASATNFLAAVTNNNGGFSGATTSGLLAGTGLIAGETALVLPGTTGADVAVYNAGTAFASRAEALAALNATGNWITQDATGAQDADGIAPDAPFLSAPLSPLAGATFSIGGAPAGPTLVSFTVDRASAPEGSSFTFTATLSAAAAG